jgi:phosphoserine phosphatase
VAFDLDSTLIDADAVDEFAKLAGKGKQAAEIRKKAIDGKLKPEETLVKRAKLLKGVEYEMIKEAAERLPLMKGAREAAKELKDRGMKVCVISGSFDIVAERVKKELGLDYAVGNELIVKDGTLTGDVKGPTLKEGSKGEVLVQFAKRVGVPLYECAAVGNGVNDASMLEKAGLKIAFNSALSLSKIADVVIEEKDLTRILPHVFGEADVDALRKRRDELRRRIGQLKKDISQERTIMRDIGGKKRDIINAIRIKNTEANKFRAARDELNEKVKATKAERDKANEKVKAMLTEFKALQEKAPKGDFKKLLKEVRKLEWNLQTRVMEIKKEDALVERINKLNQELEDYKDLIRLSKEIDENKKNSRKLHEKILALSQESQQYHESFLQAIDKIRELETKIDEYNKQKEGIAPSLDEKRAELKKLSAKHRQLEKEIKVLEEETDLRSSRRSEKELKDRAENVYERFKRGEKLDLEDIYLLRRFNLV